MQVLWGAVRRAGGMGCCACGRVVRDAVFAAGLFKNRKNPAGMNNSGNIRLFTFAWILDTFSGDRPLKNVAFMT